MSLLHASAIASLVVAQVVDGRAGDALGVLAVASPPGPGVELVEVTLELRQGAAGQRSGVLDTQQLRNRMSGPSTASLEELDRAYEGARAAHLSGDHEAAVRALRSIVEELERSPESDAAFGQWERAVLRLAKSEVDLGRPEAARGLLDRLVRADADVVVDRDLYPARFAQQVEQARAALRAEPLRELRIEASSDAARVFVNGRAVGEAPLTLRLPRGIYRVSGVLVASRLLPQVADLREAGQAVFLDFAIPEALRPALGPGLALEEGDRSGRIISVGGYMGLSEVITVTLAEESGTRFVVGALHDVRRGMLIRDARVRIGQAGAVGSLARFLVSGVVGAGVEPLHPFLSPAPPEAPPGAAPAVPGAAPPGEPSRALGWGALGTAIGAVGLSAYAIYQGQEASRHYAEADAIRSGGFTSYQAIVQYNQAISRGDAARHGATLGWAGAGACAVATGLLGYWSYRRTGEFGPFRF